MLSANVQISLLIQLIVDNGDALRASEELSVTRRVRIPYLTVRPRSVPCTVHQLYCISS